MSRGYGKHGYPRGPYGTNEGDVWLAPDSPVQKILDEEGLTLIHEIVGGEEKIYTTDNQDLIDRARAGHELWIAEQAKRN